MPPTIGDLLLEFHTKLLRYGYSPGHSVRVVLPRRLFVQLLCELRDESTYSPSAAEIAEGRDWTKESPLPDSVTVNTPAGRLTVSL